MTQENTIEQALADIIQKVSLTSPANKIAKAILSSGLVIPVSALDGMVEKISSSMWNIVPAHCDMTYDECKKLFPKHSSTRMYNTLAQAAINAIKQEAGKV